jgi:ParB/RepB/Spo0J family partition protein
MLVEVVESSACKMWEMHVRLGDDVTAQSCAALIESIRTHGIKQPVLGRKVAVEGRCEIELIYGARRLFAAQRLGLKLPVKLCDLDDRAALVEMDIENRLRRDITPYERGVSYRRWLSAGLFKNQMEMAKALGISEAQVSRVLKFAELPAAVLGAFDSVEQIREGWAVELARCCQDAKTRHIIIRRAREVTRFGAAKRPHAVYAALMQEGEQRPLKPNKRDEVVKDSRGKPLLRVGLRSRTVHLILPRENITDENLRYIVSQLERILSANRHQVPSKFGAGATAGLATGFWGRLAPTAYSGASADCARE